MISSNYCPFGLDFDQFELAQTTPHDEPCAQVGSPDYIKNARIEARAFINQIIRENGNPPDGVSFKITSNPHDFGTYLDVSLRFLGNEVCEEYVYKVEGNTPSNWDAEAKKELAENGYLLES
jgi:hypothetical protein